MYSTCLYCTKDLGKNEVIETLPIGRRIAFDASQGRLWVVCRSCAKWNLVPFDSRLESIDAGERLFRDTRVRFSTDNIGIARLKEGLELVRVGPALRPEFAAWRYGDQFGRRRRQMLVRAAGLTAIGAGLMAGGAVTGLGIAVGGQFIGQSLFWSITRGGEVVARISHGSDPVLEVNGFGAMGARFHRSAPGEWGIKLKVAERRVKFRDIAKEEPYHIVSGAEADQLLASILAHLNRLAGRRSHVSEAVKVVESGGSLPRLVSGIDSKQFLGKIADVPVVMRLATEMAMHEASERRALEGELALLEREWKEADRLAKIADSLALE